MSYIGRGVDAISNVEKLDNITFNGGTTYALTKSSAAFTPVGANNILVSIDGVIQNGNFTVSGTNIVFDFSPTSSNTCNFVLHYGVGVLNVAADDSVSAAKISSNAVTTAKINADAVTGAKIADDAIDSEHYADGSIDTEHLGNLQVTTAKIAADAIDGTKLADDAVDSEHYTDASIDNAHLADDAVGVAELSATGTASSSTFLRGDNSWAAAGGGKLLQVQSALITGSKTNNATTYKACNIVDSITCSATSSKVLVIVSLGNTYNSVRSSGGGITLTRHTAVVADGGAIAGTKIYECNPYLGYMGSEDLSSGLTSMVILDSPSSTSEQFYQVFLRLRTTSGGGTFYIGMGDDLNHSVTLMEIGA